jgi:hypothetical protein
MHAKLSAKNADTVKNASTVVDERSACKDVTARNESKDASIR